MSEVRTFAVMLFPMLNVVYFTLVLPAMLGVLFSLVPWCCAFRCIAVVCCLLLLESGCRSRHSNYATSWTFWGLNPGRNKIFFSFSKHPKAVTETLHPVQWVPVTFFPGVKQLCRGVGG